MSKPEILLGITGGIAAYKTADLASKLVQAGYALTVVMTESATRFMGPATFEALSGRHVYTHLFPAHDHHLGEHIELARRAQLMVVAPATANYMGRVSQGLADDLLSTLALTITCPLLLAPAMNTEMWNKAPVQRNLKQLQEDGIHLVGPESGWLSCGQIGPGRMAEPPEIFQRIQELLPLNSSKS
ncbi:Phosphopantothenoylcysteine decarboxylase [Polystyrenella longa]|uniref:Phosphopantothenoylcysteine decarboxylase n=1 Tax=Polystyrenella longa TaxID=2528007 RepID=A0A518CKT3_9PLAN|nr:phosphopantothenoylcysteine decarboxylase [Polystyrenella longa]QDU79832.1 Phosphopantothenoylcysteine decarboxylase [Polystyrenella longa]